MEEVLNMGRKFEKKWKCKICLRQFCFVKGAARHNILAHQDQARFEQIGGIDFNG